jgi:hypothetical protein
VLAKLKGMRGRKRLQDKMSYHLIELRDKLGSEKAGYPGIAEDKLFESSYRHKHHDLPTCEQCTNCRQKEDRVCYAALSSTCRQLKCQDEMLILRRRHVEASEDQEVPKPIVHFGLIASGDTVMKSGQDRDEVAAREGVIAFEMEGAGVWENLPCVVIKGVCDYADSHKNKVWQNYAAATAAACMKAFLEEWTVTDESLSREGQSRLPFEEPADLNQAIISERQRYLDSLAFPQIDARLQNIKNAHDRTCLWLLDQSEYKDWLDPNKILEHHGFLWIKGKPGAGKSTMMKYALADARKEMPDTTIISFFFNARGEVLEKSILGMYRSLLFQLLTAIPELQNQVVTLAPAKQKHGEFYEWHFEELKDILASAIGKLGRHRLTCFIDALDECEEEQLRDMVDFLEDLGRVAVSSQIRLNICLSSRHYPYISIEKGIQLIIEDQQGHHQDIAKYVDSKLKAGSGKQIDEVKAEILSRASGVFLWVFLVVQILNKAYDHGHIHALQRRLKEIPNELDDLFTDILTRDSENKEELVLCLQWILYAQRPLKRAELYFAIRSGIEPNELTEWNPNTVTNEVMERFILSCSKGLAEITKTEDQTVQFIHESVRDFLLLRNGLGKFKSGLGNNIPGLSHERLKQCCQSYITIDISSHLPLNIPIQTALPRKAKYLRKLASKKFPFLEYAVHNMLSHADIAEGYGVSQQVFLERFTSHAESGFRAWITLNNLLEQYEIHRHTLEASILYILAEKNLSNLILIQLKSDSNINIKGERYNTPVGAALSNANEKAVRALLSTNANACSMGDRHQNPLLISNINSHEEAIQFLLQDRLKIKSKARTVQTLLTYAVQRGHKATVELLLATCRVDVDFIDNEGQTPL